MGAEEGKVEEGEGSAVWKGAFDRAGRVEVGGERRSHVGIPV